MKLSRLLKFCTGLLLTAPALATEAPVLRFATEEWPPYFSSSMPGDGVTGALLGAVVKRMGYAVRIDYYPWKRALDLGLHDRRYAGAVAMVRNPEREKICYFSSAVGSRQTVLAYLKANPVSAATLSDLRGLRIGTVAGYSNGEQFDGLARSGVLAVEEATSDDLNLRKLFAHRFGAIVIERRSLRYLLTAGRYTRAEREQVGIADNLFAARHVHVCFQHTAQGLKQQRAFDGAARAVDLAGIERDYWRDLQDADPAPARP